MDRIRRFLLVMAIGSVALAACAPAPTPSPSPTVRPTPTPVPGPTLGAQFTLDVVALGIELKPRVLDVPARTDFVIHLRNADPADILHAVEIRELDATSVVQSQEPIAGGTQADFEYDALPPGDYVFICQVHPIPSMTGTLRVR